MGYHSAVHLLLNVMTAAKQKELLSHLARLRGTEAQSNHKHYLGASFLEARLEHSYLMSSYDLHLLHCSIRKSPPKSPRQNHRDILEGGWKNHPLLWISQHDFRETIDKLVPVTGSGELLAGLSFNV